MLPYLGKKLWTGKKGDINMLLFNRKLTPNVFIKCASVSNILKQNANLNKKNLTKH